MSNPDTTIIDDGFDTIDETPETQTTPPAAQGNDELKSALADLTKTVSTLATPKPEPKLEMTQDEKDELWAVYNPTKKDPKFIDKFFRLTEDMTSEQKQEFQALFQDFQQGITRQSVVGARNLFQMELQKLREEFGPIVEHVTQAKAEATRSRFFEAYGTLGEKTATGQLRYGKIIDATARTLAGQQFKNEQEYFQALADGAAEAIKGVLPEFELGAKKQTKPTGTTPRLPRTSVGGTGGVGSGLQGALSAKGDATDDFLSDD